MSKTCALCKLVVDEKVWENHDLECANCHVVPVGTWLMLPHQYEEYATERELSELDHDVVFGQTHQLRSLLPSMKVETRYQIGARSYPVNLDGYPHHEGKIVSHFKSLGSGNNDPSKLGLGDKYVIDITYSSFANPTGELVRLSSARVSGSMIQDTIYKNNETNRKAKSLAFFREKNQGKVVFWPNIKNIELGDGVKESYSIKKRGGALRIVVTTYNESDYEKKEGRAEINLMYEDLAPAFSKKARGWKNKLLQPLQRQLKIKNLESKYTMAFRGKDDKGMEARFILTTAGKDDSSTYIKDIEVSVTLEDLEHGRANVERVLKKSASTFDLPPPVSSQIESFTCNPRDINDVEGLVRALEYHIGNLDKDDANHVYEIKSKIDRYRIDLEGGKVADPPRSAVCAINSGVRLLWDAQKIGALGFAAISPQYRLMLRNKTLESLIYLAQNMVVPEKKKFGTKGYRLGERGKAKARLRAVEAELMKRMKDPENKDHVGNIKRAMRHVQRELVPPKKREIK